jgi:GNAT superfamily N-acetyltransferase
MSKQNQQNILREGLADIKTPTAATKTTGAATMFKYKPSLNASAEDLKLAFVENLFDLFRAMAHLPGAELEQSPQLSKHLAFPINPMFKGVWQSRLTETESDAVIPETIDWFKAREAPFFFWWLDPGTQPAGFAERLKAHGFAAWEEHAPGMTANLDSLHYDLMAKVPKGFEMERVQDKKALLDFKEAFIGSMEIPEWAGQAWVDATLEFDFKAPWQCYVGRLNGKPVASNMLFCGAGVASVFGVGTLPEARGQGIGAAITLLAYQDAKALAYRYGVLFSSELGKPVYERIGFKDTGFGISRYLWRQA